MHHKSRALAAIARKGLTVFLAAVLVVDGVPTVALAEALDGENATVEEALVEDELPEAEPAETLPTEAEPAEEGPAETEPIDSAPEETEPAETKPAETESLGQEEPEQLSAETVDVEAPDKAATAGDVAEASDAKADAALTEVEEEPVLTAQASESDFTPLALDEEMQIHPSGGEEEWLYVFTPEEDGRQSFLMQGYEYQYFSVSAFRDPAMTQECSLDVGNGESEDVCSHFFDVTAGEPVYFRIAWSGDYLPAGGFIFSFPHGRHLVFASYNSVEVFYTGEPVVLQDHLQVYDWDRPNDNPEASSDEYLLEYGTDYEITRYATTDGTVLDGAPTDVGEYMVTIHGIGAYCGTRTVWLTIKDGADLNDARLQLSTSNFVFDGNAIELDEQVTDPYGTALTRGIDYELELSRGVLATTSDGDTGDYQEYSFQPIAGMPSEAGVYQVRAVAVEGGAYRESTSYMTFYILEPHDLSLGKPESITTNLSRILGVFTAPQDGAYEFSSDYGEVLVYGDSGLDSLVSGDAWYVSSCYLAESQTVYVLSAVPEQGDGDQYTASLRVSLAGGNDISSSSYSCRFDGSDQVGTMGEPVTLPPIQLSHYDGETGETIYLTQGVDFEVTGYQTSSDEDLDGAPTGPGSYCAVIEGRGEYFGMRRIYFWVTDALDLQYARVDTSRAFLATGEPVYPVWSVSDEMGNVLTEGEDYAISYAKREPGSGTYGDGGLPYTVLDSAPSEPGSYKWQITAADGSAYAGTKEGHFCIAQPEDMALGETYGVTVGGDEAFWVGRFSAPASGTYDVRGLAELMDCVDAVFMKAVDGRLVEISDPLYGNHTVQLSGLESGEDVYLVVYSSDIDRDYSYSASIAVTYNDPSSISYSGDDGYYSCWNQSETPFYTGEPIEHPDVRVAFVDNYTGEYRYLTPDEDFVIAGYQDMDGNWLDGTPTEVGEYAIVIQGIGDYTGENRAYLTIASPQDLAYAHVDGGLVYLASGEPINPVKSVTDAFEGALTEGTDYVVQYARGVYDDDGIAQYEVLDSTPVDPGIYGYRVATAEGGAYTGESAWVAYGIVAPEEMTLGEASHVTMSGNVAFWAGRLSSFQRGEYTLQGLAESGGYTSIAFAVLVDGELVPITDFHSGDDWVPVDGFEEGEDVYVVARRTDVGTTDCNLVITYNDPSDISYVGDYGCYSRGFGGSSQILYTGEPVKLPEVYVSFDDWRTGEYRSLMIDEDFVIASYQDAEGNWLDGAPSAVGNYYLVIQGIGAYTGEARLLFTIVDLHDLQYALSELGRQSYMLTGEPVVPEVTVVDFAGNALTEGVEYELAYYVYDENWDLVALDGAPSAAGWYVVHPVALEESGYFGAAGQWEYEIVDAHDLSNASITGPLGYYVYREGVAPELNIAVTDVEGNMLSEGVDYELAYACRRRQEEDGSWSIVEEPLEGVPSEPGEYLVYANAVDGGEYHGSTSKCQFLIYQATPLTQGETIDFLEGVDTKHFFSFTAPQDGEYTLQVYGNNEDEYGFWPEVFTNEQLTANANADSESFEGQWATFVYTLKAGETLYLRVDTWGPERDGSCHALVTYLDPHDISGKYWDAEVVVNGQRVTNSFPLGTTLDGSNVQVRRSYQGEAAYLNSGVDFELIGFEDREGNRLSSMPTDVGSYSVIVEGRGSYYGTAQAPFWLYDPSDLSDQAYFGFSDYDFSRGPESVIYLTDDTEFEAPVTVRHINNGLLTEGVDYSLDYAFSEDESGDINVTVTATGLGSYHGSITATYIIASKVGFEEFVRVRNLYIAFKARMDECTDQAIQYLYTGRAITPGLVFMGGNAPALGIDYTVSYKDASGQVVQSPTDIGRYTLVAEATDDGILRGTFEVPFEIANRLDLYRAVGLGYSTGPNSNSLGLFFNYDGPYREHYAHADYSGRETITYSIVGILEDISRVWWSLADGVKSLVENLDFVTNIVRDEVYNRTLFTFTGIGDYEGTVRAWVYAEKSTQDVFATLVNADGRAMATVLVDAEGTIQKPAVMVSDLTMDVDYEIVGVFDNEGTQLSTADPGTYVYVHIVGLGAYEECTGTVPARVERNAGPLSLDSDFRAYVENGFEGGDGKVYVLSSEEPLVSAFSRSGVGDVLSGVRLAPGQGYTVSKEEASDGSWLLTLTADDSQLLTGTMTLTVWPVDSFDMAKLATHTLIRDLVSTNQRFDAESGKTVELTYGGVAFTPAVTYFTGSGVAPEYKMTLTDGTGTEVQAITGPGTYTMVLSGVGKWTGEVRVPLTVVEDPSGVDLAVCDVTLGKVTVEDGEARPDVTVSFGGYEYAEGVDYVVTCGNNTEPGATAWVKIEGAEGSSFYGYVAQNFSVPSAEESTDLSDGTFTLATPKQVGDGWEPMSESVGDWYAPTYHSPYVRLKAYPIGRNGLAEPEVMVVSADGTVLDTSNYQVSYGNNAQEGVAFVKVTGVGDYTGTLSANFYVLGEVPPIELTDAMVSKPADVTYTGEAFEPQVTVTYDSAELTQDVDYTVAYADNVAAGTASVTVEGMGDYAGTVVKTFQISPKQVTVTAGAFSKTYGEADPQLTATEEGLLGSDAVDYELSREPGEDVGSYAVTATGAAEQGNYAVMFVPGALTIDPKTLDASMLTKPGDVTYDGTAQTPDVTIKDGTTLLTAGRDFTATYENNTNVGTAKVTVTGTGNYAGKVETAFDVTPRQAVVRVAKLTKTYGEADPKLAAAVTGLVGSDTVAYTLWREQGEAVGSYHIGADAAYDQGNYQVTVVQGMLTITARELTEDMLSAEGQTYAGAALRPAVVTCGGKTLVEGTDYEATYANNVNVGTATVVVTGKGNYAGELSTTFAIWPKAVAVRAVDVSKTFGQPDPEALPVAVDGALAGEEGLIAYEVSRAEGEDAGSYAISVTGASMQGNYAVTYLAGTLTVEPASLAEATVSGLVSKTYTGSAIKQAPAVTLGETELAEGTDYAVAYQNNVNAGTATVTVTGMGNYAGSRSATFKIAAKPVSRLTVAAVANKAYTGSAIKPALTVKDGTKVLKAGTDYDVAYKNNVKVGTATATLTGKGNYSGTRSVTFKVVAASVVKATVSSIASQKYDGKAKTPRPTVKVGGRTLKLNTDYTLSYKNNVKAGTATVTIKGKGGYTGAKSVTFKIVAMAGTWKKSGSRWWYEWRDGDYPANVFLDIDGSTYRFDASGWMLTGWQQVGGKWYYFGSSGAMVKSKWVGNYWMGADGVMATNAWVDGGRYYVGSYGAWVKGKTR